MDIVSYIIGKKKGYEEGEGNLTLEGELTFTDTSSGTIVIMED